MAQKPITTTYPWSGNKTRNTMRLERSFIETEDDGRFNWDFNGQTQVIVVNQNETNQYGEYRGYRSRSGLHAHVRLYGHTLSAKAHQMSRVHAMTGMKNFNHI